MLLIIGMLIVLLSGAANKAPVVDNTPVADFDVERFLGKWYEIARFDSRFEKDMQFVHAYYYRNEDNTIHVANKGAVDGESKLSVGKVKTTDTEGLLRVSFFPLIYSDFRILYISEDYDLALIGSEKSNRLWILSRESRITDEQASDVLEDAIGRGYDVGQLNWITQ